MSVVDDADAGRGLRPAAAQRIETAVRRAGEQPASIRPPPDGQLVGTRRTFLSQTRPANRFAPGRLRRRWQQWRTAPHSHRRWRVGLQVESLASMANG